MNRHLLALFGTFVLAAAPMAAWATEVKEVVTPGGIKAWLVEEHALPLIAVKIAFRDSGSAHDPAGKEGLAAMTAAMLTEGAGELDWRAFNEALENNAVQLNFGTDEDLFRASLESLSEHREKAFSYLALALSTPRLDDSAIERVRSQTQSVLIQQEHEPGYILHREWEKLAFGTHPYANPELGTPPSVSAITKDDLADFVNRYLTKENIIISVVGDITPAELSHLLDTYLAALPEHYAPMVTVPETPVTSGPKQIVIENDIPQTMVIFGENGIKRDDPNYYAGYVMSYILGGSGSLTSKLLQEIRNKRGLAYSLHTNLDPMLHSAVWEGGVATRNEKVGEMLQALRTTLRDFADKGPTDKELADSKKYITGSFVLGLDSNADVANYLTSMQLFHLGRDYLDKRNGMIEAVRQEDVKTMAQKLADPDHLLVVMVGKPDLGKTEIK